MGWPTPQDYSEAVQNPQINFEDAELRSGRLAVNAMGLPVVASGSFASVYRVSCESKRQFAVRCFLQQTTTQHERYQRISKFVMTDDLPYTVDFNYLVNGIRVQGKWYPVLKMDWVDGLTLDAFVRRHLHDKTKIAHLADQFVKMTKDLQDAGIAHGDLQHGNILVTKQGELRLVDYDGMFVPDLSGMASPEIGHRNYQHPERDGTHFNERIDNFSAWSIATSLRAISLDPELAVGLQGCDECLLFRQADYRYPLGSRAFYTLEHHNDKSINALSKTLRTVLSMAPDEIPFLSEDIEPRADLPQVTLVAEPEPIPIIAVHNKRAQQQEQDPELEFRQSWPSLHDYVHAVTNPMKNFVDSSMHDFILIRDHGSVRAMGTDHGAVFKFRKSGSSKSDTNKPEYAVKVWLKADDLLEQRYKSLYTFLNGGAVNYVELEPHFVPFVFIQHGLRVGQHYYPIVRMKYTSGLTLFEAVEKYRQDRAKMKELISHFIKMMARIESSGIIHGDIEPENIIVKSDRMVLVDYDLTTVPLSRPLASRVKSNKHYRHPMQPPTVPPPNDNFAAWLMYYSMKIISLYPAIWNIAGAKPGRLLFSDEDLRKPHTSHLFRMLKSHYSESVRSLAADVEKLLKTRPSEIEALRVKMPALQVFEHLRGELTAPTTAGATQLDVLERSSESIAFVGAGVFLFSALYGSWIGMLFGGVFLIIFFVGVRLKRGNNPQNKP